MQLGLMFFLFGDKLFAGAGSKEAIRRAERSALVKFSLGGALIGLAVGLAITYTTSEQLQWLFPSWHGDEAQLRELIVIIVSCFSFMLEALLVRIFMAVRLMIAALTGAKPEDK